MREKLNNIIVHHDFIMVDYNVFPHIGVVEFEIIGKDYFPFALFSEIETSLGCLSTLSPSVVDGQNSFKLVLTLQ